MLTTLRIVPETEKAHLWVILSTYLRELNQYGEINLEYPFFSCYWADDARWPYFIESGENIAGFVLLNKWSPSQKDTDFAVAEFYVLPEFRGSGVGRNAFTGLLDRHPGTWELSVMGGNKAAKKFWERIIRSSDVINIERFMLEDELIYRFATTR